MRYFLLFLLLVAVSASAQTPYDQTWEVPAFSYSFERKEGMGTTANYQWIPTGGTWYGGDGAAFNAGTGVGTRTGTRSRATCRTDFDTTSVRLNIVVTMGGTYVPVWWQQARKVGDTAPPKGGPYDSGGNPTTPEGDPVNENGDPVEPPKRHYAENTYTNTTGLPVQLLVVWATDDNNVIKNYSKHCEAGSAYKSFGYYHKPFSISIQASVDGIPIGDIKTEPSVPIDDEDPNHPEKPDPGEPGGEGGPASGGGQSIPGTGQVPTPDPVTPEPRPGDGEQNDESRHKELMAQVGRVVSQVGSAANQAAMDADRTNELLGDIKDNTAGGGSGGPGGSGSGGTFSGPGPGSTGIGSVDGGLTGIGGKITNIRAGAAEVVTAAGSMVGAMGLSPNQPALALRWTIPTGRFGNIVLDLETMLAPYLAVIRSVLLFFLGLWFVQGMLKTVKETFA